MGPTQPPIQWVPVLFPGCKTTGAWRWSPTPSSAGVKERVEPYLYSPSGPSLPVLGWTLPLPLLIIKLVFFTINLKPNILDHWFCRSSPSKKDTYSASQENLFLSVHKALSRIRWNQSITSQPISLIHILILSPNWMKLLSLGFFYQHFVRISHFHPVFPVPNSDHHLTNHITRLPLRIYLPTSPQQSKRLKNLSSNFSQLNPSTCRFPPNISQRGWEGEGGGWLTGLPNILTRSMEQSPSWEANWFCS